MTRFASASKAGRAAWLAAAAGCAVLAPGAAAAAEVNAPAPAVQAVVDCRKLEDPARRLACYDEAVTRMQAAQASGDLVTVDREQRRAARRQAFGFNLPSLSFLDRGEKPDEADRVTATVAAAGRNAQGRWVIRLEDGAVWRQIDDNELGRPPRAGMPATLRRGALGSYFMNVGGELAIRVHRDN